MNSETVELPLDRGLAAVLEAFGVRPEQLVGHGGEAWVYALDDERVLRVLHEGGTVESLRAAAALADQLSASAPRFLLPELLQSGEVGGRCYGIERRLPGRPVLEELERVDDRTALIEAYLQCTSELGDLALEDDRWWGDVLREPPVRADTWPDYLCRKANASLVAAGKGFERIDARSLAAELPPADGRSFVHLDAFPGNVLAVGSTVTAVIDLGGTAAAGDRRIDPLSAVVYLTPAITPTANDRDRDVAHSWLRNADLAQHFDAAQRWLAAYWSFAVDDARLHAWCRSVLL